MDILRQLIQTIVVIVILAVLLEMLLPRGDMRRYVKMVMGLLIIVALLQAVTDAVNSDLLREVPVLTESPDGYKPVPLEEIMAAGKSLAETNREAAAQKYSVGVARQVLSLAGLNPDVSAIDARVQVGNDNSAINNITIIFATGNSQGTASPGFDGEPGVQPVSINSDNFKDHEVRPTEAEVQSASRVAEMVANFYNLRKDQVDIEFQ